MYTAEVVIEAPEDFNLVFADAKYRASQRGEAVGYQLVHREPEPIVVRGRTERHRDDCELPQISRADPGYTWLNVPGSSHCWMVSVPYGPGRDKLVRDEFRWFHASLMNALRRAGFQSLHTKRGDPNTDIYADSATTEKIVGTSIDGSTLFGDALLARGCWYESGLQSAGIDDVLRAETAETPFTVEDVFRSVTPIDGFAKRNRRQLDLDRVCATDVVVDEARETVGELEDCFQPTREPALCLLSGRDDVEG